MPPRPRPNNRTDPPPRRLLPLWPLGVYRVAGDSMRPTYAPGDTLLGWRWFRPRAGQVVVAIGPHGRPVIKRVSRLVRAPDAPVGSQAANIPAVWLLGDNPAASTDSRHFGAIPRRQLVARIIARLG